MNGPTDATGTRVSERYGSTLTELRALLDGEPRYRVDQVWRGLWTELRTPDEMTNVPASLRSKLDEALPGSLRPVTERTSDDGLTTKFLWALHDGNTVETVLMHYEDRSTVCVSSQAGCAMGCSFCATGQAGYERHLTVGEISEQVVMAARAARPRRVSNVVFMGMGEPFANYDAVLGSITHLHDDLGISARRLTVSTVGLVPGIRKLSAEALPVNLAVSLHAANDTLRDELVPPNRRYPLAMLAEACAEYFEATHRRISFEWAMIDGVNDSDRDADELAAYARPLRAHINLIPLNPTPGYPVVGSSAQRVRAFAARLNEAGVNTTIRDTRGRDIDGACGQLRATHGDGGTTPTVVAPPTGTRPVTLGPRRR